MDAVREMTVKELLEAIIEIAYEGHPDGRADRLVAIGRFAQEALKRVQ